MHDHGLTIEVRHEPDHVLVTVAGEADIATAPQLQERLASLAGMCMRAITCCPSGCVAVRAYYVS
jgi:hypothetical protein